jgi:cytosine/adenosine deaminase-related metal-dependent hydrolase
VQKAYRDAGMRVVFSPMVSDIPPVSMVRYRELLPPEIQEMLGTKALAIDEQIEFLEHQINRHPAAGALHWAVAPFAPQRCTPKLLERCQDLADRHDLQIYTHVYETRAQRLIARDQFADHKGSFIEYFASVGMLGPRLNIVHSVWIERAEMDRLAEADAGIVLNHLSNLKLKSGIAPVLDMRDSGVRLALGCDNCSGSDVQNMFQAMKTFALFGAVSDPEPGPGLAAEALRHGTLGSARSAGLGDALGAIEPGRKADMFLVDTGDIAWQPFNSAARQLVYTETGRAIESVIIDGKLVMKDRKVTTIDEDALRREVAELMKRFIVDYDAVVKSRERALPHMLAAHRRVWSQDLSLQRFIARTR